MKNQKRTLMKRVPSSVRAVILAVVSSIGLIAGGAIIGSFFSIPPESGEWIFYLLHSVVIAIGCYIICRKNPKSFWYVPLLANVFVFLTASIEPSFWHTTMWIFFGSSLPLSILGAYLGALAYDKKILLLKKQKT